MEYGLAELAIAAAIGVGAGYLIRGWQHDRSSGAGRESPADPPHPPATPSAVSPAPEAPADPFVPDDLQVIKGIGPKMETALHEAGFTRLAHLADLGDTGVGYLAEAVGPSQSRILREDWVGQAKRLLRDRSTAGPD